MIINANYSHIKRAKDYIDNRAPAGWFDDYHTYEEITSWLYDLETQYAGVSTEVIGQSYEGRDQTVLKIEYATSNPINVWIEAGIHAREWISPAVAQYIIDQLLETPEGEDYTDRINFYILVNTNPDGYSYTWTDVRSNIILLKKYFPVL